MSSFTTESLTPGTPRTDPLASPCRTSTHSLTWVTGTTTRRRTGRRSTTGTGTVRGRRTSTTLQGQRFDSTRYECPERGSGCVDVRVLLPSDSCQYSEAGPRSHQAGQSDDMVTSARRARVWLDGTVPAKQEGTGDGERLCCERATRHEVRLSGAAAVGHDPAPVASRALGEVARGGGAVGPLAQSAWREQLHPKALWRSNRCDTGECERVGQGLPAEPRDVAQALGVDRRNPERGEAVETVCPRLHQSRGREGSRGHVPTSPRHAVSVVHVGEGGERRGSRVTPRVEQLVPADDVARFVLGSERVASLSHACGRGELGPPQVFDRVGDAPTGGRRGRGNDLGCIAQVTRASSTPCSSAGLSAGRVHRGRA